MDDFGEGIPLRKPEGSEAGGDGGGSAAEGAAGRKSPPARPDNWRPGVADLRCRLAQTQPITDKEQPP